MSTARRDALLAIEKEAQQQWETKKLHEIDAPLPGQPRPPKFFSCFPFPYMNGKLHLGHGFSLSKAEFCSRYQRMKGYRSVWPFGFHVTGTPIAACAQRIQKEMAEYGNPPVFPDDILEIVAAKKAPSPNPSDVDLTKHKSKRGKTGPAKPQWQIMESMGIPPSEIPKFADPMHWIEHFPPIAIADLHRMGCHIDYRRAFITTEVNPYFDAFVKWQFRQLREKGLLAYGKRYCVYSPWDKQPCADHDRASGEGALPQEFTVVKLVVQNPAEQPAFKPFMEIIGDRNVVLPGATLRAETVIGQTNCWVSPNITYKAYAVKDAPDAKEEIYIMVARAARNMAFQDFYFNGKTWEDPVELFEVSGTDMLGIPLTAPMTPYKTVYTLPMNTIVESKGTGVVMCVPTDSPDDHVNFATLKSKPEYCKKLGIKEEWIKPFEELPIINTADYGDFTARAVCEKLKVNGPNDSVLLEEAKKLAYQAGFYQGTMIAGPFKGKKVSEAKVLTQNLLMENKQCIRYYEPVRQVTSRSGDECIVALCDQWFLEYGKEEWRDTVLSHVAEMNMFSQGTKNAFVECLGWLADWPCSRTFGLGTYLPCDASHSMIIDSLSDSTIYMAYYTIARFFHVGKDGEHKLAGNPDNAYGLKPEMFTDDVFEFIFHGKGDAAEVAASVGMPIDSLTLMRNEFEYFYPVDIRCSGKDLIQNHLTMFLYNHAAIWPDDRAKWPRSIFCNGQILVNNEKMAKSKGNFITVDEAITMYGADPTRLAMADAGDSLDDANFVSETATGFIMKLTTVIDQAKELLARTDLRTGELTVFDRIFSNNANSILRTAETHYNNMQFRSVLNSAFHEFGNEFSQYKLNCDDQQVHRDMAVRFYEMLTLMMMPLAPHFAEYMWQKVLQREGSVVDQPFPVPTGPLDYTLVLSNRMLTDVVKEIRAQVTKNAKKRGPINAVCVYTVHEYGPWQSKALQLLQKLYHEHHKELPANVSSIVMASKPEWMTKDIIPETMAFLAFVRGNVEKYGEQAMSLQPVVDDFAVLSKMKHNLTQLTGIAEVAILPASDETYPEHAAVKRKCRPGEPVIAFPPAAKK